MTDNKCINCPVNELSEQLNNCRDYISELETRCEDQSKELRKANLAVEYAEKVAEEEVSKNGLFYRDGIIAGLKYAIRCMSGGEANK